MQLVGAGLAKRVHQQAAREVQTAMHDEALGGQQLPELLNHFKRKLRGDTAQVGQLLCQTLHIGFGQSAQNLPRHLFAYRHQQHRRLANAGETGRLMAPCKPVFSSLLCHNSALLFVCVRP